MSAGKLERKTKNATPAAKTGALRAETRLSASKKSRVSSTTERRGRRVMAARPAQSATELQDDAHAQRGRAVVRGPHRQILVGDAEVLHAAHLEHVDVI